MIVKSTSPLFLQLFNKLSSIQSIKPGLDAYFLLFRLLDTPGFKLESIDNFMSILETMWLKSLDDRAAFRQIMKEQVSLLKTVFESITQQKEVQETTAVLSNALVKTPLLQAEQNEKQAEIPAAARTNLDINNQNSPVNTPLPPVPPPDLESDPAQYHFDAGKLRKDANFIDKKKPKILLPREKSLYMLNDDYFPVRRRDLLHAWKRLSVYGEYGTSAEVSIEGTVDLMIKNGFFSDLVYKKKTVNERHLLILLDNSKSMVAVGKFGRALLSTAAESGLYMEGGEKYFNGIPVKKEGDFFLNTDDGMSPKKLKELLTPYFRGNIVVLIYSDAGGFAGDNSENRKNKTLDFVGQLKSMVSRVAWINPVPAYRWEFTNAADISEKVPMFEATKTGIDNAVAILKGKPVLKP
ncbi:hypothetical protein [Chitinophaga flava]|uniref:VWA containing CoxE family protein n=1 Tax=Chitinophaga flava TaxID=2259036 RepID=A0A365Y388_9BACT|nr:hypothetical protein [Chitinophaga flava]RBL93043.1 hypothetical protein DF182_10870 [Chitinophaga flava]